VKKIKLRAWEKELKTMVYKKELCGHVEYDTNPVDAVNIILNYDDHGYCYMLHTGEKDDYNKEIYEKDILKCRDWAGNEYITTVRFESGAFIVDVSGCDYDEAPIGWALNGDITECEIIGNEYENPELSDNHDRS